MASGGNDHTVRIWDAKSLKELMPAYTTGTTEVLSLAWSPDGKRLAIGLSGGEIHILDISDDNTIAPAIILFDGHTDDANCVAWSPDGNHLASASADHTVRVWKPQTGDNKVFVYKGHSDAVHAVAWSKRQSYACLRW